MREGLREALEREDELRAFDGAVRSAAQGAGSAILIEGPPGIGKTALLEHALTRARAHGARCLSARAGERERDLDWSVVRDLFARMLGELPARRRYELFAGASRLALRVLSQPDLEAPEPAGLAPVLHGLYWLVAHLTAEAPLVLAVDDAHWADLASLRWLEYLAARASDLRLVLAVSTRPEERPIQLSGLASHRWSMILGPAPLSPAGCRTLLATELGCPPDAQFADTCAALTAGNPFLLRALATWLREQRISPVAAESARLKDARPEEIERWALLRMAALPAPAAGVAQAAAILGRQSSAHRLAALARIDLEAVAGSVGVLQEAGFFSSLEFAHPLLRSVVYGAILPARRAAMHREAARLIEREHAAAGEVAQQLMFTEPTADASVVATLRAAAAAATAVGSPATAVSHLTRALAEPPTPQELCSVLLELGRAEGAAAIPSAVAHLSEAHARAEGPVRRAEIAVELALRLVDHVRLEEASVTTAEAIEELRRAHQIDADAGRELELTLGAVHLMTSTYLRRGSAAVARLGSSAEAVTGATPAERMLLAARSQVEQGAAETATRVGRTATAALAGGRLLAELGPESGLFWSAATALIMGSRYRDAEETIEMAASEARRRGSAFGYAMATCFRSLLNYRRGRLPDAVADAREALAIFDDTHVGTSYATGFLTHALIDAGEPEEAEAILRTMPLDEAPPIMPFAVLLSARGRLRLSQGYAEGALSDLERVPAVSGMEELTPQTWPWRADAALALATLGRAAEAEALAERELELSASAGSPWAHGIALQAAGVVSRGQAGLERLEEAVAVLESSGAELEYARALVELGLALHAARDGERSVGLLRKALDLADRCGAVPLADRARAGLVALGTRPRRARLTGVHALTPMERRVADQAAAGASNREIAEALFVSVRTVESHLTSAYRKLAIDSRSELAEALSR